MNTNTLSVMLISVLTGFVLSRAAQAVSPPPDGGYPVGNTAEGQNALFSLTSGGYNTAISVNALGSSTIGDNNIALGDGAGINVTTASDVICIGTPGADLSGNCFIGQISGAIVPSGVQVIIDVNGHLGTIVSSRRFKNEIKPMNKLSEAIFALKPVSFRYTNKLDPTGTTQFGLVAEDVERVNPELVACDKQGNPYAVRYEAVNAMLLNEFLKEHKKVEELEHSNVQLKHDFAEQQKQIAALTAGLQKVSAQLEVSKRAPQTVVNNQ
jgi:Chaperone of endosialidase